MPAVRPTALKRVIEASPGYDPAEWDEGDDCRFPGQLTPIGLVRWSIARSGIEDANSGEERNYAHYENIAFKLIDLDDEGSVVDDEVGLDEE